MFAANPQKNTRKNVSNMKVENMDKNSLNVNISKNLERWHWFRWSRAYLTLETLRGMWETRASCQQCWECGSLLCMCCLRWRCAGNSGFCRRRPGALLSMNHGSTHGRAARNHPPRIWYPSAPIFEKSWPCSRAPACSKECSRNLQAPWYPDVGMQLKFHRSQTYDDGCPPTGIERRMFEIRSRWLAL